MINEWNARLIKARVLDKCKYKVCQLHLSLIVHVAPLKGAVSRQSSSFCLILPITRPQSLWNLK